MPKYKIQIKKSVKKDISSFDKRINQRLIKAIQKLKSHPYTNAKKITGKEFYRVRVGKYRIVYEIKKTDFEIIVYKIGHRKDIYKL